MRLLLLAALLVLPAARLPAQGPVCREPRYRWSAKTDTSLAALKPQPVAISVVLSGWEPAPLTSRDRCAQRAGRERALYSVPGWVRRVEKIKDDGDWHLELTERRDSPTDSCIVVEIPPAKLSARYAQARADLDAILGSKRRVKNFNLAQPVYVRITGAAFYDGQHRRGRPGRERLDGEHGRCNSSARALWEIHPVYRVERPQTPSLPVLWQRSLGHDTFSPSAWHTAPSARLRFRWRRPRAPRAGPRPARTCAPRTTACTSRRSTSPACGRSSQPRSPPATRC